jgi:hypothetical protein
VTGFQVTSLAVVIRDLNETGRVRRTPSGSLSWAKMSRAQPTVRREEDHPPRRFREVALTRSIFPPKSNRWRGRRLPLGRPDAAPGADRRGRATVVLAYGLCGAPRRGCGPTRSRRRATSPRLHHALPRDDPSTRLTRAYGPHRTKSSGSTAGARRRRPPTEAVLITPSASSSQRRPQPAPGRRGSSRACSSHPESARMSRTRSARTRRKGPATK